jgi:hypothetical protein
VIAEDLARALGGVKSGRQWKCRCVVHDDAEPSMIVFDGREQVQVRCLALCEPADIIAELRRRGLWTVEKSEEKVRKPVSRETDRDLNIKFARSLFDRSIPCADTMAQDYLERREIWCAGQFIDDIRFCPTTPRKTERVPAIIVAMRSFYSRDVQAVQRIYLRRDPFGATIKDGKPMMLGAVSGTAMRLQLEHMPGLLDEPATLNICEGLETGLSILCLDHGPVWALGSTSNIQAMPVLDDVEHLVIWEENDAPGIKAAHVCCERWQAAGRLVTIGIPTEEGADAADVWRARLARL